MVQWFAIEEPFDLHVWIANWRQLTFEFGLLHFDQRCLVLDLNDKSRWLLFVGIVQIFFGEEYLRGVFLDSCFHLHQLFRSLHALWYLILQNDRWELCIDSKIILNA